MTEQQDDLIKRINNLVSSPPYDVALIEQSTVAFQHRLTDVFLDLGIEQLTPKVQVVPDAESFDVIVVFPVLGRYYADKVLRKLEDIARLIPKDEQINQNTALRF